MEERKDQIDIDHSSLGDFQTFKGLSGDQLEAIASYLVPVFYNKGESIIRENSSGDSLYILYKGRVDITRTLTMQIQGLSTEEKKLTSLSETDKAAFGENGLVGAGKRTANVIAATDCIMYRLSSECFKKIVEKDIQAGYRIMHNISKALAIRLAHTDEDLVKLATAFSIALRR